MTVPLVGVVARRLPVTVRATGFSMIQGMAVGASAAAALLSGAVAQLTTPAVALGWMALLSVGVVAALAPPLLRLREGQR
jgi:fatty acid desaturase